MSYHIFLNNSEFGTTDFEKSDAPMGVVFGRVSFFTDNIDYSDIKSFCLENNIGLANDYAKEKFLTTNHIPGLKIVNSSGEEIKGQATVLEGSDGDGFEIIVLGIPYPFYEEEFPQHVMSYNQRF